MEFTINVQAMGDFDKEDLRQYILHCLGVSSIHPNNPFIDEDCDAKITDIDID